VLKALNINQDHLKLVIKEKMPRRPPSLAKQSTVNNSRTQRVHTFTY